MLAIPALSTATWKQKDGTVLRVSQMTTSHLWFSIRLMERRVSVDGWVNQKLMLLYRERERRLRAATPTTFVMGEPMKKRPRYWILENGEPKPVPSVMSWARWLESLKDEDRRVAYTSISADIQVSTVFLGIDHSFGGPVPLLFETMVFGGVRDGTQWRTSSRADALATHQATVAAVEAAQHEHAVLAKVNEMAGPDAAARIEAEAKARVDADATRLLVPATTDRLIDLE